MLGRQLVALGAFAVALGVTGLSVALMQAGDPSTTALAPVPAAPLILLPIIHKTWHPAEVCRRSILAMSSTWLSTFFGATGLVAYAVLVLLAGGRSVHHVEVVCDGAMGVAFTAWHGRRGIVQCAQGLAEVSAWRPLSPYQPHEMDCLPLATSPHRTAEGWSCESLADYRVRLIDDRVSFAQWQSLDDEHAASVVVRDISIELERKSHDVAVPFEMRFGTSQPELQYQVFEPAGATVTELLPSPTPPRRVFLLRVPAAVISTSYRTLIRYRVAYNRAFGVYQGTDMDDLAACANCDLSLRFPRFAVERYHLGVSPPPGMRFSIVRLRQTAADGYSPDPEDLHLPQDSRSFVFERSMPAGTMISFYLGAERASP